MTFTRKIENFVCEYCDTPAVGNGFTNHCPKCLWSKHVDIDPGDRLAECAGMMEPMSIEEKGGVPSRIRHKCLKCGFERMASIVKEDSLDQPLLI